MKVTVIGNGYVGTVTATCLAWLGHDVVGLEENWLKAEQLSAGQLPFYEPGLSELLSETLRSGKLRFTSDPSAALCEAEVAFLCVGTPMGPQGRPDLSYIEQAVRTMAAYIPDGVVVATKSTVPIRTGEWIRALLDRFAGASRTFSVISNPEFLREGSAIHDFLYPDRIVVGGDQAGVARVLRLFEPLIDQSFPGGVPERAPAVLVMDLLSAEMTKYAANALLATKISFANEIATLCEMTGADARHVLPAVGADARIGTAFLAPGIGWGGSCFPKDIAGLIAIGRERGHESRLLRAVVEVNDAARASIIEKLRSELGRLDGRRIALLGLAFKPGTDDLREAPSIQLIRSLLAEGASLSAYDPVVKDLPEDLQGQGIERATDPYEAGSDADAVVVATEWHEFAGLDLAHLVARMRGNVVVDGRNVLDAAAAKDAGMRLVGVGWRN